MKDIAFHITDIAGNCIRAEATEVGISLCLKAQRLGLTITDDGCGMDAHTLQRVTDPFYTTRTTRRVGLGLPFLFQNAEQCGGSAEVRSRPGVGTEVTAVFPLEHIDCPPVGNLGDTFMQLVSGNPSVNITLHFCAGEHAFSVSTAEIIASLDGIPLGHPQVAALLRQMIVSNLDRVFGDALIR